MNQQGTEKDARRAELEKLGPHDLLQLARHHGINFLNGPFVIEAILDDEFPERKHSDGAMEVSTDQYGSVLDAPTEKH